MPKVMTNIIVLSVFLALVMVAFKLEGTNAKECEVALKYKIDKLGKADIDNGKQQCPIGTTKCWKFKCKADDGKMKVKGCGDCNDAKNWVKEQGFDYNGLIGIGCKCEESAGLGMPSIGQIGMAFGLFATFMAQRLAQHI